MRKFSSYGPVNTKLHYYVPRQALVNEAYTQPATVTSINYDNNETRKQ